MSESPRCAQRGPYRVQVVQGREYAWCACGRSATQPLCDGSHAGSGIEPWRFVAERTGELFVCGCKATLTPPLCDGSHKRLAIT